MANNQHHVLGELVSNNLMNVAGLKFFGMKVIIII